MAEEASSQARDQAGRSRHDANANDSSDPPDEKTAVAQIGDGTGDNTDDEQPEDDDMPPLAEEPSAGLQAVDIQRMQAQSCRASTLSRVPTIVPRSKRRGLFGRLAVLPEVERPFEYPNQTKWLITLVVSLSAAAGPMGSSIFYPALSELAADLNVTTTLANLTVAMYMLAMSIFPLWWSSFSETFGRRTIYIVSFTLFVVFAILCAISHSIGMLIVMRVLSGGASASVQAVGAGTLADIWQPHERGRAMGIFYLGPLTGPLLAPIIGGALAEAWGWQSTMWFLAIFGGLSLIMLFFCLPETLSKSRNAGRGTAVAAAPLPGMAESAAAASPLTRVATSQSVRVHTHRVAAFLQHAFVHPLSVLLYLRFPPIILTVVYGSVTFGALFILNVCLQSAYGHQPYGFSEIIVGLLYIPGSLGYILAAMVGGRWIDMIMAREARRAGRYDADGQLQYLPEDRMRENAWLAASLFPAALIWFGWTVQHGVFWVAPAVANFIFGFGSMLVFGVVTTMLTEFMPRRSSGGIALNNFLRNIFSCVGVIVAQPLIDAMGYGWLCTMVALLSWVIGNACIWALRRYSQKWRVEMDAKLNKLS
ncbi:major facilitator superfamily transporter multidrug resistance [Grosmannia clavigera kw1407]|uniref:Major facilitator superfamily transporter multidrug resistance n=1 Tax=Grosmannia clavigera (strain kw1407 / UAMH 11150) TaxID=655863 RepID=F0XFB5_GROCL|nr:major facilitator superfamily transporter multidrug resistance [Grosmannia clavigera kw1407]EFX03818.1 major facilitator superfamily transporter multidrug resistance [Grosmannia clavigera kw1407]